ncbi:hypothetical protein AXZ95_3671 [Leifsonia sp. 115AMFTsu3.1]|nr:hypothetical protein AXZ95_3671 [Leifsonia sp. 115AMFTsu3.1]
MTRTPRVWVATRRYPTARTECCDPRMTRTWALGVCGAHSSRVGRNTPLSRRHNGVLRPRDDTDVGTQRVWHTPRVWDATRRYPAGITACCDPGCRGRGHSSCVTHSSRVGRNTPLSRPHNGVLRPRDGAVVATRVAAPTGAAHECGVASSRLAPGARETRPAVWPAFVALWDATRRYPAAVTACCDPRMVSRASWSRAPAGAEAAAGPGLLHPVGATRHGCDALDGVLRPPGAEDVAFRVKARQAASAAGEAEDVDGDARRVDV